MAGCGDDSEERVERAVDVLSNSALDEGSIEQVVKDVFLKGVREIVKRGESLVDESCRYGQINLELSLRRVEKEHNIVDTLTLDFRPDDKQGYHRRDAFEQHPLQAGLVTLPQQIAELSFCGSVIPIDAVRLYYAGSAEIYTGAKDILQAMRQVLFAIKPFEESGLHVSVTGTNYFTCLSFLGGKKEEIPDIPKTYHTHHDISKALKDYLFEKV